MVNTSSCIGYTPNAIRTVSYTHLFMKNSLKDLWGGPLIQEYPEGMVRVDGE